MTIDTLALPHSRLTAIGDAVLHGFRRHAVLYAVAGVVVGAALLEAFILGLPMDFTMLKMFSGPMVLIVLFMTLAGLVMEMVRFARSGNDGSVTLALGRKLRDDYFAPMRVSNAIHATIYMSAVMAGYTFIKKAIPAAHPFAWDEALGAWDKALHFGWHPYELVSFLNVPVVTYVLNINYYNVWFLLMFTLWFWQGFSGRDTRLRLVFLLSFALTWFFGTCILGTIFSSVGPCFYGRLLPGEDPYAPALAWLSTANESYHLYTVDVIRELWRAYDTGTGLINGISAMPSMHVGSAIVFALLGISSGKRWLGWALSGFAVVIMITSVHLTMHYAIDGYASLLIATAAWRLAGWLIDWSRPELRANADNGLGSPAAVTG